MDTIKLPNNFKFQAFTFFAFWKRIHGYLSEMM